MAKYLPVKVGDPAGKRVSDLEMTVYFRQRYKWLSSLAQGPGDFCNFGDFFYISANWVWVLDRLKQLKRVWLRHDSLDLCVNSKIWFILVQLCSQWKLKIMAVGVVQTEFSRASLLMKLIWLVTIISGKFLGNRKNTKISQKKLEKSKNRWFGEKFEKSFFQRWWCLDIFIWHFLNLSSKIVLEHVLTSYSFMSHHFLLV